MLLVQLRAQLRQCLDTLTPALFSIPWNIPGMPFAKALKARDIMIKAFQGDMQSMLLYLALIATLLPGVGNVLAHMAVCSPASVCLSPLRGYQLQGGLLQLRVAIPDHGCDN